MTSTRYIKGKEVLIILIPMFLVLIFLSFFFTCNNSYEFFYKFIIPDSFHGNITRKYIDRGNKGEEMIIIKNEKGEQKIYGSSWIGLYEFAEINDSLYKQKNDSTMIIVKANTKETKRLQYFIGSGISIGQK
jgi:hypothetical protein